MLCRFLSEPVISCFFILIFEIVEWHLNCCPFLWYYFSLIKRGISMNRGAFMNKKITIGLILFAVLFFIAVHLFCEEMPEPNYENSVVFSFTYSLPNSDSYRLKEMVEEFGNGMYTILTVSNFTSVDMNWFVDPANAELNISAFKQFMESLKTKASESGVGIHLSLSYGMARSVNYYKAAKEEDIRNAQWYNDNNLATQEQLSQASAHADALRDKDFFWRVPHTGTMLNGDVSAVSATNINRFVYTTPSRYARKLRRHLEAKTRAAFLYLLQFQAENPDIFMIISGPGEAELNALRQDNSTQLQAFFCDYSPFAVLEFRDWITHQGLYADNEIYYGQGYPGGGARYRGSNGLKNFNSDFGTSFQNWNLKYYHWSLTDPVDSDYTDSSNPDPNIIPVAEYAYGSMMPASGVHYNAGGFDPPRVMKQAGVNSFWDLWQQFRIALVAHYVHDITALAASAGLDMSRYYTHQIPADYLFGTRPNDPAMPYLNQRYYTSASPLSTAVVNTGAGAGVTMYDINFGTWYARTSEYLPNVISTMTDNWGVMEYNPEILAKNVEINTVDAIYNRMKMLYDNHVHMMNFYKWDSTDSDTFRGTNREKAAKQLFDAVKTKARRPVDTMFTGPRPVYGSATYIVETGAVQLNWSSKMWKEYNYFWDQWQYFKHFGIYRGFSSSFITNASSLIGTTEGYSFKDTGFNGSGVVYYKVAAVNVKGEVGTPFTVAVNTGSSGNVPVLNLSRSQLYFGAEVGGAKTSSQFIAVSNSGTGVLNWAAAADVSWIALSSASGSGSGQIQIDVNPAGVAAGIYNGNVTVTALGATGSPQTIAVTLHVYSSGQDAVPFGYFETPGSGASVSSSIAVTGWVLDDIGIQSVKIYRKEGSRLIYIGDAALVEGARPDVRKAYPEYPDNTRAGWGYMLLTNFLPDGGNGTYTLHVIASDVTGHQVTLGMHTIYCDNDNAVKPFGAIDTPLQGGTAHGLTYVNFGWVLTPQPNYIPEDGSTIDVYIDGINVGHPVYNRYRSDIAELFPGYANSEGAVGYYFIDTTAYADGVHTIAWSARDSGGNVDGIGSRYFTISNQANPDPSASVASGRPLPPVLKKPAGDITVLVRKGCGSGRVSQARAGVDSDIQVHIRPMERLVLQFPGDLRVLSRLPVGASLDSEKGTLYWLPGIAFAGTHVIDVLCKTDGINWEQRRVIVTFQ